MAVATKMFALTVWSIALGSLSSGAFAHGNPTDTKAAGALSPGSNLPSAPLTISDPTNTNSTISIPLDRGLIDAALKDYKWQPDTDNDFVLPTLTDSKNMAAGAHTIKFNQELKEFIYVYDLPSRFNEDLLNGRANWESMYAVDFILHQRFLSSEIRATDAEKATLFFVPVYATHFFNKQIREGETIMDSITLTKNFVKEALDEVQKQPYWNRKSGFDHVLIFAHDFGRCFLSPDELAPVTSIQYNGDTLPGDGDAGMMAVRKLFDSSHQSNSNVSLLTPLAASDNTEQQRCFIPENDIVVPPYLNFQQHISEDQHPTGSKERLAFFCGAVKTEKPGYSFGVRQNLQRLFKDDPDIKVAEGFIPSYINDMKTSSFCLSPPGHAQWSLRMTEAITLGCPPVTFNENNQLPWEHLVDYKLFSLNYPRQDLSSLKRKLTEVSNDQIKAFQAKLLDIRPMFSWVDHPYKVSAFQLTVEALHAKSLTISARLERYRAAQAAAGKH